MDEPADSLQIEVSDLQSHPTPQPEAITAAARLALQAESVTGAKLSIALVTDSRIQQLHRDFLNLDSPTDVLTFELNDPGEAIEGEIVISVDTAMRNCQEHDTTVNVEILLYVIHGILHLCGYDDRSPEPRALMHQRQQELLESILKTAAVARAMGDPAGGD